jgi:hypothetical protein
MAKKTVFEGVINGVKFDNVQSYNDTLTRLLAAGEEITASTSTRSEGVGCNCCENECCQCECKEPETVMMLPGCIIGRDNDKSYVDSYVSDNAIADKQSLEELEDELSDNMEGVIEKIHKMDRAALEGYLKDVNEAMGVINADYKSTKRCIAEREQEIERLHKESQKLGRATKVLELWHDNYLAIKATIEDAMTVDNTKPSRDNDDLVAKELENRLVGALTKLANILGVDPKDFKNVKIGY